MPYKTGNFAYGRLSEAVTAAAISIPIRTTDPLASFPTLGPDDWTYGVIFAQDGNPGQPEIVRINAITGNVLSCTRGVGRTVAQAWRVGDRLELRTTAEVFDDVRSPPPPQFLTQAEYSALDPVDPEVLYAVEEPEDRPIPEDALLTGARIIAAYRTLPAGARLTPDDLDGFVASVQGVLADARAGGFTFLGPVLARCVVPGGTTHADDAPVAAAVWTIDPLARAAWSAPPTGADLTWITFVSDPQGGPTAVPANRQDDFEDGWWLIAKDHGVEMDRIHIAAGAYGTEARPRNFDVVVAGNDNRLRVTVRKQIFTVGMDPLHNRTIFEVRGAGTEIGNACTLELRAYRLGVVVGG